MGRIGTFVYGAVAYLLFLFTFCYMIGFVGNLVVPKSIDSGATGSVAASLVVNLLLMSLFAVQHSVMARPFFKRWWSTIVPERLERSTFVLLTSLILLLLAWQWRPLPSPVWHVDLPAGRTLLTVLYFLGWGQVLYSTWLIDHFDLFGMRQVYLYLRGVPYSPVQFQMVSLYKWVRHPLLLGFMIAFWTTPVMSQGHLLFAVVTTAYMLVAIHLEEHDLLAEHGEDYAQYRRSVAMLLPFPRGGGAKNVTPDSP